MSVPVGVVDDRSKEGNEWAKAIGEGIPCPIVSRGYEIFSSSHSNKLFFMSK